MLLEHLAERLRALDAGPRILVALSGGLDSTVLLHACRQLVVRDGRELAAVHVDHGLQAASADWARHCQDLCAGWGLSCTRLQVDASAAAGESPEAAAREARMAALAAWLPPGSALLLGHHQEDQAETLLLRLLRGAGPEGLAAMAQARPCGPGRLLRPLLGLPRQRLREYAEAWGLTWIEDPSNADTRFDRNFLRQRIWPQLCGRWPGLGLTLARAAELQADAAALVQARGEGLLHAVLDPQRPGRLPLTALAGLALADVRRLLRAWLRHLGLPVPGQRLLDRVVPELLGAAPDRNPCLAWPGGELRRHAGGLHAQPPLPPRPPMPAGGFPWPQPQQPWNLIGVGRLRLEPAAAGVVGLDPALLSGRWTLRWRQGGERLRPAGSAHHAKVKHLLQQAAVPPWLRERWPLVYVDDVLVAVPGVALAADAVVARDGLRPHWQSTPG